MVRAFWRMLNLRLIWVSLKAARERKPCSLATGGVNDMLELDLHSHRKAQKRHAVLKLTSIVLVLIMELLPLGVFHHDCCRSLLQKISSEKSSPRKEKR